MSTSAAASTEVACPHCGVVLGRDYTWPHACQTPDGGYAIMLNPWAEPEVEPRHLPRATWDKVAGAVYLRLKEFDGRPLLQREGAVCIVDVAADTPTDVYGIEMLDYPWRKDLSVLTPEHWVLATAAWMQAWLAADQSPAENGEIELATNAPTRAIGEG